MVILNIICVLSELSVELIEENILITASKNVAFNLYLV